MALQMDRHSHAGIERSESRMPYIQGLRALAVLVVVAFHAGLPIPGGFIGVDVFFVISGFVITLMLMREFARTDRIRLLHFYKRRFMRLAPALALMSIFTLIASALLLSPFGPQQRAALTGLGAELSVANFVIAFTTGGYFDLYAQINPFLHTWSLSVEEQFYLVFPVALLVSWLAGRKIGRQWPVFMVVAVGTLFSFFLALVSSTGWTPSVGASLLGFYSPATRAWEFGVGVLLALAIHKFEQIPRTMMLALGWLGILLFALSLFLITETTPFPGPMTMLPVMAAGLLLIAGIAGFSAAGLLDRPAMVRIGDWSYSIYLWHWPLIVFASLLFPGVELALLAAAAISFLPAAISYVYVEQPLRRRSMSRSSFAAFASVTIGIPVLLSIGLYQGAQHGWGLQAVQEEQSRGGSQGNEMPPNCMSMLTIKGLADSNLESCVFNEGFDGPPIYLVGDSNAAMYASALFEVSEILQRPLFISTAADCPFIDGRRNSHWGATADAACRDFFESTRERLSASEKGTVVLSSSIRYADDSTYTINVDGMPNGSDTEQRTVNIGEGLRRSVSQLQSYGHKVVLVEPTLRFGLDQPITLEQCSLLGILRNICPMTVSSDEVAQWQKSMQSQSREIAQDVNAEFISTRPYQCPAGICGSLFDEVRIYDDPGHITMELSRAMSGSFRAAIDG